MKTATGRAMFNLWVNMGLCICGPCSWDYLSPNMKARWNELARKINQGEA